MTPQRAERMIAVLNKRQPDLTVVLENVFDPHNISAVMRSCDAVGIQEIFVLNTKIPRHEKWGFRSSSGSYKWMTVHQFNNVQECVEILRSRYNKIFTTQLTSDSIPMHNINFLDSVALVFGNEQFGISEELLAHSDGNFIIPQVGMIQSLNISVACAVTIYEAYRQKNEAGHYDQQRLSHVQYNGLLEAWGYTEASE